MGKAWWFGGFGALESDWIPENERDWDSEGYPPESQTTN